MTLLSIKQASEWASEHYKKTITTSNISYLVQYGRIKKIGNNSETKVIKEELIEYYESLNTEQNWKKKLGDDLNWELSFDQYRESETTKHVHRLHPYKGKFIPQLVKYFLDDHKDKFKKEVFFKKGDTILDPFCGSGTLLVQANELGMNAIGIDISEFNKLIANVKVQKHEIYKISNEIDKINDILLNFIEESNHIKFEKELINELNKFNSIYFPSPSFKYNVRNKEINEREFGLKKEKEFEETFNRLVKKYNLTLKKKSTDSFMEKWYLFPILSEIELVHKHIEKIKNNDTREVLEIILSRTIRSCRATTHSDLATLIEPINSTYYCHKHYKICKPLFSIFSWWKRYSKDTIKRLNEFDYLRTNSYQICLTGDSRNINIYDTLQKNNSVFSKHLKSKKINGIFSSPPYVGLIDYHEQHAYAYNLFGYDRKDKLEIGPLFKGKGKEARESYVKGISEVLLNCKKYLVDNYNVFLVANDKFNLYPRIAENADMRIVNQYKRPVLNRTEKNKTAYSEIIFHLKEK